MDQRLQLQTLLEGIPGVLKVYFQAPGTERMVYPCILYKRDDIDTDFASNKPYRNTKRYQVTVIDRNPDSQIVNDVASLPQCTYSRHYRADQLNHDVFNLYF